MTEPAATTPTLHIAMTCASATTGTFSIGSLVAEFTDLKVQRDKDGNLWVLVAALRPSSNWVQRDIARQLMGATDQKPAHTETAHGQLA